MFPTTSKWSLTSEGLWKVGRFFFSSHTKLMLWSMMQGFIWGQGDSPSSYHFASSWSSTSILTKSFPLSLIWALLPSRTISKLGFEMAVCLHVTITYLFPPASYRWTSFLPGITHENGRYGCLARRTLRLDTHTHTHTHKWWLIHSHWCIWLVVVHPSVCGLCFSVWLWVTTGLLWQPTSAIWGCSRRVGRNVKCCPFLELWWLCLEE